MVREAALVGWIKISRAALCLGIAVFRVKDKNYLYVAETNYELLITDFLQIDEQDQYEFDWDIPPSVRLKIYSREDPVPIPLGLYGRCVFVHGTDDCISELLPRGTKEETEFSSSIQKILLSARSGILKTTEERFFIYEFKAEFDDVLVGDPVHSRHWVNRLRLAWKALDKVPSSAQDGFRDLLNRQSSSWWERFSKKSDIKLLLQMLELMADGIVTDTALAKHVIELLRHEIEVGELNIFQSDRLERLICEKFPNGFYEAQIEMSGRSRRFALRRVKLIDWFNREFKRLSELGDFYTIWRLSIVLFGACDPPAGDIDVYRQFHRNEVALLEGRIRDDLSGFFKEITNSDGWAEKAEQYVTRDNHLKFLRRVYDGSQRSPSVSQDEVGGISQAYRGDLEMYLRNTYYVDFTGRVPIRSINLRQRGQLPSRVVDWLDDFGPLDRLEADHLLSATFGQSNATYSGKIRNHRMEVRRSDSDILLVKGKEKIKRLRTEIEYAREQYLRAESNGQIES